VLRRLFSLAVFLALCAGAVFVWSIWQPNAEWGGFRQRFDDAKTAGGVKAALGLNRDLAGTSISVSAEEGVVTLRGEVGRPEQLRQAQETALAVAGVRQVVSHLHVGSGLPRSPAAGRSLGESIDDTALEVRVRLAFSLQKALQNVPISVSAYRRRLTLSGTVATTEQRETALHVARETPGVGEVVDDLKLEGRPHPAADISRARKALAQNASLKAYRLEVRAEGSEITVIGSVRSAAERDLAGLLVETAVGRPIRNAVTMKP
jgi:hyperosmotically inducible protein